MEGETALFNKMNGAMPFRHRGDKVERQTEESQRLTRGTRPVKGPRRDHLSGGQAGVGSDQESTYLTVRGILALRRRLKGTEGKTYNTIKPQVSREMSVQRMAPIVPSCNTDQGVSRDCERKGPEKPETRNESEGHAPK